MTNRVRRLPGVARARLSAAGAAAVSAAMIAAPSHALTILPHYDLSITSLSNAAGVEAAFNTVVQDYAKSFANPVTVNVNVSWGKVAGQALPSNAVGASSDSLYGYFSYAQVANDLKTFASRNAGDTALATAVKSLPATAPAGPANYVIASAEARALGLVAANSTVVDGSIGFAGSTSGYDFNPLDGVNAGTYDFEAVAAHELAEVMGRISGIDSTTPAWRTPFDLFRYKSPGVLSSGYNDAAYFSINGGATNLRSFNNSSAGGDRGDWLTASSFLDVDNAFISTGRAYTLSASDLTSLDVLGWGGANLGDWSANYPNQTAFSLISEAVPEPAQWVLMIVGVSLTGVSLRSRRRRPQPVRA